jgi:hypothetical protein
MMNALRCREDTVDLCGGKETSCAFGWLSPCTGCSAEELIDEIRTEPGLLVVLLTQCDVVERIEVPRELPILIQPEQWPGQGGQ